MRRFSQPRGSNPVGSAGVRNTDRVRSISNVTGRVGSAWVGSGWVGSGRVTVTPPQVGLFERMFSRSRVSGGDG